MRLQDLIGFELALSEPADEEYRLVMYTASQRQALYISEVFRPNQPLADVSFDNCAERRTFLVAVQLLQSNSPSWTVKHEWIVDLRLVKPATGKRQHGLIIRTHSGPVAVSADGDAQVAHNIDSPQVEQSDNPQPAGSWLFSWGKALNTLNTASKENKYSVSYSQLVDLWTLQHSIDEARAASLSFQSEVDRLIPCSSLPLEEKEQVLNAKLKRIQNHTNMVRANTEKLRETTSASQHHQRELSIMLSISAQQSESMEPTASSSRSANSEPGNEDTRNPKAVTEYPEPANEQEIANPEPVGGSINGRLSNRPANPPANPPASASANEPANEPANGPSSAPADEPTNEPTNRSASAPADEPANESTNRPASAPVNAPANAPTSGPTYKPASATTNGYVPVNGSASRSANESQAAKGSLSESVNDHDTSASLQLNNEVSDKIKAEQSRLASELLKVFPIEPVGDGKFHFTILGLMLPSVFAINHYDTTQIGAALGFVAQVVVCISRYLDIALPYPITVFGSQSYITDNISQIKHGSNNFPLWTRGVLLYRVEYALYLLHKDIEQLLNWVKLAVVDLKQTLANLKNLLLVISNK